jgi:alpha-galactosidase
MWAKDLLKSMTVGMVASAMKDAGYQYVAIDDCWQVSRDADGNIVADGMPFPSGSKALVDYIHSKELKFGIYATSELAKECRRVRPIWRYSPARKW